MTGLESTKLPDPRVWSPSGAHRAQTQEAVRTDRQKTVLSHDVPSPSPCHHVHNTQQRLDLLGGPMLATVSVRYIVDDVEEAIAFYTEHLGFGLELNPAPG